jgi:ribosome-associated protein
MLKGAALRRLVADSLDSMKAREVLVIDVRDRCSFTDWIVIASGTSDRHVRSIALNLAAEAKQAGVPPIGVEGEREGQWVLVDLGDIVVHVMMPDVRAFYGLEKMWQVDAAPKQVRGAGPA